MQDCCAIVGASCRCAGCCCAPWATFESSTHNVPLHVCDCGSVDAAGVLPWRGVLLCWSVRLARHCVHAPHSWRGADTSSHPVMGCAASTFAVVAMGQTAKGHSVVESSCCAGQAVFALCCDTSGALLRAVGNAACASQR